MKARSRFEAGRSRSMTRNFACTTQCGTELGLATGRALLPLVRRRHRGRDLHPLRQEWRPARRPLASGRRVRAPCDLADERRRTGTRHGSVPEGVATAPRNAGTGRLTSAFDLRRSTGGGCRQIRQFDWGCRANHPGRRAASTRRSTRWATARSPPRGASGHSSTRSHQYSRGVPTYRGNNVHGGAGGLIADDRRIDMIDGEHRHQAAGQVGRRHTHAARLSVEIGEPSCVPSGSTRRWPRYTSVTVSPFDVVRVRWVATTSSSSHTNPPGTGTSPRCFAHTKQVFGCTLSPPNRDDRRPRSRWACCPCCARHATARSATERPHQSAVERHHGPGGAQTRGVGRRPGPANETRPIGDAAPGRLVRWLTSSALVDDVHHRPGPRRERRRGSFVPRLDRGRPRAAPAPSSAGRRIVRTGAADDGHRGGLYAEAPRAWSTCCGAPTHSATAGRSGGHPRRPGSGPAARRSRRQSTAGTRSGRPASPTGSRTRSPLPASARWSMTSSPGRSPSGAAPRCLRRSSSWRRSSTGRGRSAATLRGPSGMPGSPGRPVAVPAAVAAHRPPRTLVVPVLATGPVCELTDRATRSVTTAET